MTGWIKYEVATTCLLLRPSCWVIFMSSSNHLQFLPISSSPKNPHWYALILSKPWVQVIRQHPKSFLLRKDFVTWTSDSPSNSGKVAAYPFDDPWRCWPPRELQTYLVWFNNNPDKQEQLNSWMHGLSFLIIWPTPICFPHVFSDIIVLKGHHPKGIPISQRRACAQLLRLWRLGREGVHERCFSGFFPCRWWCEFWVSHISSSEGKQKRKLHRTTKKNMETTLSNLTPPPKKVTQQKKQRQHAGGKNRLR